MHLTVEYFFTLFNSRFWHFFGCNSRLLHMKKNISNRTTRVFKLIKSKLIWKHFMYWEIIIILFNLIYSYKLYSESFFKYRTLSFRFTRSVYKRNGNKFIFVSYSRMHFSRLNFQLDISITIFNTITTALPVKKYTYASCIK